MWGLFSMLSGSMPLMAHHLKKAVLKNSFTPCMASLSMRESSATNSTVCTPLRVVTER